MEYCLDTGHGTASIWTAQPDIDLDGDGALDGLRLDMDGDGLLDDAVGDSDGDGYGDFAVLNVDDGAAAARYTDDGSGSWSVSGGAVAAPLHWRGLDGVEHTGPVGDVDGDGVADQLLDTDRDGWADRALRAAADGVWRTGYVDTDGDGRWDLILTDADGDGTADGASPYRP